jgi:hypothetical protein
MIRVTPAPEPASFSDRVRKPGQQYLATISATAPSVDFTNRSYWRTMLPELHAAYDGICAYSCHRISLDTGADTVEHFIPKSLSPRDAYEWENYRLVCARLNGRKGSSQDVVDPFLVERGMFQLHFPSLCVVAGRKKKQVANSTIQRLKLNDSRSVEARQHYIENYLDNFITFEYVAQCAPFLALELKRQGFSKGNLAIVMGR